VSEVRQIHCCGCDAKVNARLTNGAEIYPHLSALAALPLWRCDTCGNYVGCHHKTGNPTNPLGNIPTKEIRNARQHIHRVLDPLWQTGRMNRKAIYARITAEIGWKFHTAKIRSVEEARAIYRIVQTIASEVA